MLAVELAQVFVEVLAVEQVQVLEKELVVEMLVKELAVERVQVLVEELEEGLAEEPVVA